MIIKKNLGSLLKVIFKVFKTVVLNFFVDVHRKLL